MKVIDNRHRSCKVDFGTLVNGSIFVRGDQGFYVYLKIPVFKKDNEYYNCYCFNDELFHSCGSTEQVQLVEISISVLSNVRFDNENECLLYAERN